MECSARCREAKESGRSRSADRLDVVGSIEALPDPKPRPNGSGLITHKIVQNRLALVGRSNRHSAWHIPHLNSPRVPSLEAFGRRPRCLPALSQRAVVRNPSQSETNVTTEPWSAVEWIADADLTRASFYWDSVPHCRNPPSACQVRGRAIPCSDCAQQRHDIISNRLALTAEGSVSGVTGATAQVNQETPPNEHLHHWQ